MSNGRIGNPWLLGATARRGVARVRAARRRSGECGLLAVLARCGVAGLRAARHRCGEHRFFDAQARSRAAWNRIGNACILAAVAALLPPAAGAAGFDCLIEPAQVVEIRSAVDGIIQQVHVQRRDAVRKGQPLVELQSAAERAAVDSARYRSQMEGQIASARNRIDYATKKLTRATELHQQNFASAQSRDEADAERRLAESELQAAVENRELAKIEHRRAVEELALRTVTSPFNGVVLDRTLNPGDLAEAGSGRKAVLKIAQIDPLRVDVVLPAVLFGQVKAGTPAMVSSLGGRYAARVGIVDKVMDAASGTFVARLELPNPKQDIPGGARCAAEIQGLVAPAVRQRGKAQ